MTAARLVPDDFVVPVAFDGPGFRLEPLGPEHDERDHEAWMSSIDYIRATPGFPAGTWPHEMSLEANPRRPRALRPRLRDAPGFTHTILDDDTIGCLYIYP